MRLIIIDLLQHIVLKNNTPLRDTLRVLSQARSVVLCHDDGDYEDDAEYDVDNDDDDDDDTNAGAGDDDDDDGVGFFGPRVAELRSQV